MKSVCRNVVSELYTRVITAIVCTNGLKYEVASGSSGIKIRKKPYTANLRINPVSTIDPANGASTWARGSHIWKGISGVLMAKLRKIPNHKIFWFSKLISASEIICRSDVPTL